jgi:hypothetical protein
MRWEVVPEGPWDQYFWLLQEKREILQQIVDLMPQETKVQKNHANKRRQSIMSIDRRIEYPQHIHFIPDLDDLRASIELRRTELAWLELAKFEEEMV